MPVKVFRQPMSCGFWYSGTVAMSSHSSWSIWLPSSAALAASSSATACVNSSSTFGLEYLP